MSNGSQVLVVDGVSETEEVLKAVLEPRGVRVNRIRGQWDLTTQTPGNARQSLLPTVLVLHQSQSPVEFDLNPNWAQIPRIIIGSLHTADVESTEHDSCQKVLSNRRSLTQPFKYAELIQAIEELLTVA